MRNGLSVLGVLDAIKENPESMKKYFVGDPSCLSAEIILAKVEYANGDETEKETFQNVINSFNDTLLKKLLVFVTGADNMTSITGYQKLRVRFMNVQSIFASTCTFELVIPTTLSQNETLLKASLEAVVASKFNTSFNTM